MFNAHFRFADQGRYYTMLYLSILGLDLGRIHEEIKLPVLFDGIKIKK